MQRSFRVGGQRYTVTMKEYDPNIIEYINEQLPEIIESRNHALASDDFESEYLDGIVMAYQHIIEKFGA